MLEKQRGKEEDMEYKSNASLNEFTQRIQEKISRRLGLGYQIRVQEVRKNNNVLLHGLVILSGTQNVAPTIYLNHFWEAYNQGMSLSEIVSRILTLYREDMPGKNVDMEFFKSFERVRDRICYRLVSAEKNRELLENIPHIPFLDLAVTFYYAYQGAELGSGTILVYNSHLEMWQTDTVQLMNLAQKNTPQIFPWECKSMEKMMLDYQEQQNLEKQEEQERFFGEMPMEILSNEKRIYGAACMLYPGLLEMLAGQAGANLYILPSSVHEIILLADRGIDAPEQLGEMVREVNATQVEPEEVLSDSVYYYNCSEKNVKKIF